MAIVHSKPKKNLLNVTSVNQFNEFIADSVAKRSLLEDPPSINKGGKPLPPLVPHIKEPLPLNLDFVVQKSKVDWLSFTSDVGIVELRLICELLLPNVIFSRNTFPDGSDRGVSGYPSSFNLLVNEIQVGMIGFGATHGRDLVTITGKGCKSWKDDYYPYVYECLTIAKAKLTRVDLCLDFFDGSVTHDFCLTAFENGLFNQKKCPRFPLKEVLQSTKDKNVNMGRTIYVGSKQSSKRACLYEKGLEVFGKLDAKTVENCVNPSLALVETPVDMQVVAKNWFRCEIRFYARDIVLDPRMVLDRDAFFSGSFPFCEIVLPCASTQRPEYIKTDSEIESEKMFMHARNGYGNSIFTWRAMGYSDFEILNKLDTGLHNQRLISAGVLVHTKPNLSDPVPF